MINKINSIVLVFQKTKYSLLSTEIVSTVYEACRDEKILGQLRIMKYCWPPWLADEKKFPFQTTPPKTVKKT